MPPPSIFSRAPAKLNLFLEVLGKRPDGFHEIETIFQAIDLHDTIRVSLAGRDLRIERSGLRVPCAPDEDLAYRAAEAYLAIAPLEPGVELRVTKRIPPGGGLGGGSSDAAAVLRALDRLAPQPLGSSVLHRLAAELGSDVPFFLVGGTAIGRGRGEILTPIETPALGAFLLAVPPIHVPTAAVYRRLRLTHAPVPVESTPWDTSAGKSSTGIVTIHNRLETVVLEQMPALAKAKAALERTAGRRFFVTGSGSGLFALLESREEGGHLRDSLTDVFEGLLQVVAPDDQRLSSSAGPESTTERSDP